jgi:SPP1 gp7 family putative phage head morphogenesis protein
LQLLEDYNTRLKTTEEEVVQRLNVVLEASFNRLLRRTRIHLRTAYLDPAQRNLAVLQTLRQLIPSVVSPEALDAYDKALRTLIVEGQRLGLLSATSVTSQAMPTRDRIDVALPLDATLAAQQQTKRYLARHGERFAELGAQLIAQGVLEGRPTSAMVRDLRERLEVVKSRGETIVRTESLRAYNAAANTYYAAQGIEEVFYYATSDDRTCPICTSRAGLIYKRGTVVVPVHPRCRCYLAPWNADFAQLNPDYAAMRTQHREEVTRFAKVLPSDILSQRSLFESLTPIPLAE